MYFEDPAFTTVSYTHLDVYKRQVLGDLALEGEFWAFREKVSRYATFLAVINASGQPAASLPLDWTAAGVPVASQLIGHFGREDQILRLAAELERAAPWAGRQILLP